MNKLLHLESLASSARAQMRGCGEELRQARDELNALERHRDNQHRRGFKLAAVDHEKLERLAERVQFLRERQDELTADSRAKLNLYLRCKEAANG